MPLRPLEPAHMARAGAGAGIGLCPGRNAVSGRRRVRDRVRYLPPPGRVHPDVGSGVCHLDLGDYRQAINVLTQALAIDRDTSEPCWTRRGRGCLASGDPRRAGQCCWGQR